MVPKNKVFLDYDKISLFTLRKLLDIYEPIRDYYAKIEKPKISVDVTKLTGGKF